MRKSLIIIGVCIWIAICFAIDLRLTPFIVYLCKVCGFRFEFDEIALALIPLYIVIIAILNSIVMESGRYKKWWLNLPVLTWLILPVAVSHIILIPYYGNYYGHGTYNTYGRILINDIDRNHVGLADKFGIELLSPYYYKIIDCGDYAELYKRKGELYSVYYFDDNRKHKQEGKGTKESANQEQDNNISDEKPANMEQRQAIYDGNQYDPPKNNYEDSEHVPALHYQSVDVPCTYCKGEGFTHQDLYMGNGHIVNQKKRCAFCHGKGTVRETREEWY